MAIRRLTRYLALVLLVCLAGFSPTLFAQNGFEVTEAGIEELQQALADGSVTSSQLVQLYLDRIAAYDRDGPRLNSIIRVNPAALTVAAERDSERQRGEIRGPLHGIPVILKDNYNTVDMPTTGGSVALAGFLPSANATQVERLTGAGAIILAKSNLHEFAYGITSIGSLAGQTRNPYDPRRVPGGSSGGTAAAVAASLAAVGMGSDTCGSIRIPSAFNNLVGLRPSKGLSSIYGIMPLSHTQDVGGPLARSVTDLAIVLDAVAGYDPQDPATEVMTEVPAPEFVANLGSASLEGLRIGRLNEYFERADARLAGVIERRLEALQAAGVEIVPVDAAGFNALVAGSGLIGHEFRTDLNAYLSEFGSTGVQSLAEVVDAGLFHQAVSGALTRSRNRDLDTEAYQAAYGRRAELRSAVEQLLAEQNLDALVYPPIGDMPVFTGESQPGNNCSLSANSGLPAIVFPAGFTGDGLPVGLELLGPFMSDAQLVSIAYQVEQLTDFRNPPTTTPPLINGAAPPPLIAEETIRLGALAIAASFTFDVTTGVLQYELEPLSAAPVTVHAVTLFVDDPPMNELSDPILLNLLPPDFSETNSEVFVIPDIRQAIEQNRIYLRTFYQGGPVNGLATAVRFTQPRP